MRLLLDECMPEKLRHLFPGHDVVTARYLGLKGKENGELIALIQTAGIEVLLTVDQNLPYQQNLTASGIAVLVFATPNNASRSLGPRRAASSAHSATWSSGLRSGRCRAP